MRIDIQARDFAVSEKLEQFIKKRVEKFERFYDQIIDVVIHLNDESSASKEVIVRVLVKDNTLVSKEKGETFEKAADAAIDSAGRQLRKYKEKIKEK